MIIYIFWGLHLYFNYIQDPVLNTDDVERLNSKKPLSILKKVTSHALHFESHSEGFEMPSMRRHYRHRDTPSIVSWAVWTQWPACVHTERRPCCCGFCGPSPGWDGKIYSWVRAGVCLNNYRFLSKTQRPHEEVATLTHLMKVLKEGLRESFHSYSNLSWARSTNATLWKSKPTVSLRNKAFFSF